MTVIAAVGGTELRQEDRPAWAAMQAVVPRGCLLTLLSQVLSEEVQV